MPIHIRKLLPYALAGWLPGGRCRCVICGHRVWRFMPYGSGSRGVPPLMQALDVIGSDVDNHACPRCGAHDRERHLLLYLQASGIMGRLGQLRILHFAPEKRLMRLISAASPVAYLRCDLYPVSCEIRRADIQDMPFEDASFDLVLANHVLEHVDDDGQAVSEIHRVLAAGGHAVLQTPYSPVLERTWCDRGITGENARLHAYGQADHVRLFGKDVFDRIAKSGLRPAVAAHESLLGSVNPREVGVNPREPFFLFRKS